MISTEVIDNEADLELLRDQWDALAVEVGQPYSSPAWMLSWWRHLRPPDAVVRAVAAIEEGSLVGLAPLWVTNDALRGPRYGVMAAGLSPPARLLAKPGREAEVAAAFANALEGVEPRLQILRLEDRESSPHWALRLAEGWPGRRPWVHVERPVPSPVIAIDGLDYDAWMQGRDAKFRHEMRRRKRRLEEAGGRLFMAGPDRLGPTLTALLELHRVRWEDRGGSRALAPGLEAMLADAARELVPGDRFRLFAIEAEGRVVSAQLFIAAGREVCGWNGGFDLDWRRYSPSIQNMLQAVADATTRGEAHLDLGPGDQRYKHDLADEQQEIAVATIVPRNAGYPLARVRFASHQMRAGLSARLSPNAKRRLRRLSGG